MRDKRENGNKGESKGTKDNSPLFPRERPDSQQIHRFKHTRAHNTQSNGSGLREAKTLRKVDLYQLSYQ